MDKCREGNRPGSFGHNPRESDVVWSRVLAKEVVRSDWILDIL